MRLGLVFLLSGLLFAQTPPAAQDKCRLEGKVLNTATGQPVRKANVTARGVVRMTSMPRPGQPYTPPLQPQFTAVTDSEGRFVFSTLDPGQYYLDARRDGFQSENTPAPGAVSAGRRIESITLDAGGEKRDVVLRLVPLGVLSGHVRDEDGDPLRNAQVAVMLYQYTARGRELTQRNGTSTNDLGEYRIFDLSPGKYYLKATPRGVVNFNSGAQANTDSLAPAFYPGASDPAAAAPLEVRPGEEVRGIDLILRRTQTYTVSGRVFKPVGASNAILPVMVTQVSSGSRMMSGGGINDSQGNFQLRLRPGAYELSVQAMVENKRWSVRRPIQVGASDIEGIELRPAPPVDVNGVFRIEGTSKYPLSQPRVVLESANLGGYGGMGNTREDGSFTLKDVEPGIYRVSVTAAQDLYVKSVRCGSADVGEAGIDLAGGGACDLTVTLSSNGGQINGKIEADEQTVAGGLVVTLVPTGARRDASLFKTGMMQRDGSFRIQAIAPGAYKVFAWAGAVNLNAVRYDPEFLKPFESLGQSVQISEGGKETVTLKPILVQPEK